MNREIRCRAKTKDNGEWMYGYYWVEHSYECCSSWIKHFIREQIDYDWGLISQRDHEVIPETICEYTGLKDIKGVELYEDDLIKVEMYDGTYEIYRIVYDTKHACFDAINKEDTNFIQAFHWSECEKIGNIHDNKELFEGEE